MSGVKSRGRRGFTVVPNWRWEDERLDPYALRIAGWLASHADTYLFDYVTRNAIARNIHISREKVSTELDKLVQLGIIEIDLLEVAQSQGGKRFVITFDFDVWEHDQTQDARRPPQDATRPTPGRPASSTTGEQEETQSETPPTPAATAREIAQGYWEWVETRTGKPPVGVNFMAMVKLIEPFVNAGYEVLDIKNAMLAVYHQNRPFTRQVLEQHLDGRAKGAKPGRATVGGTMDLVRRALDEEPDDAQ